MGLKPGARLGPYEITAAIGAGGMGEVYRATDTRLRRDVAIKVLPDDFAHDKERLARFEREARLLASLNHPSIASIYGLEDSDGRPCLVMELVEGQTLAQSIEAVPLPLEETLNVARRIAEALEAAHEKGIIHRDLKPANVMITPDGDVKILDFGLAKAFEGDADAGSSADASLSPTLTVAATRAGVVLGTAAYMSPEQARGRAADKRADIWSFGVVLFEMLTGKRAFTGETISDTLASVLKENPDWKSAPTETPPAIKALVARCLVKDPRHRLRDIGEARIVLEGDLSRTATSEAADAAEALRPGRSTLQRIVPWTLVAVLLAALSVLWSPWQGKPPSPAPIRLRTSISGNQPLFSMRGPAAVLSPDGRQLAYVAGPGSERLLNIRSMDQLEFTPLAGTEDARHHFFSPDGQWIAFFATGKLKKVSIHGGSPLTITDASGDRGGTWGHDGTIVFAACSSCGLSRVSSAGGSPAPLTELDETKKERSHRWPSFLPDGEHVLFMSQQTGVRPDDADIEVVSLKTGDRKVLHHGGSSPQYVPTGHLGFLREGTLFVVAFDAGRLEVSGQPVPLLEGIMANSGTGQYTFSNTGTFVYLSGSQAGAESTIVWVSRDGKAEPLLPEEGTYEDMRFSPDGKRLAVEINMPGGQDVVWVHDLQRGTMTRLTFSAGGSFNPVWTSDGLHLIFGSSTEGDVPNLYVKRADGAGEVRQLTDLDKPTLPYSASADGRFFAFCVQDNETGWDIWVLPLEGGEPEPFLATAYMEASPQFSPDSRWVAYTSTESGESEVYVRPYPGPGGRWQISAGGGFAPRWSRDGSKLFFRSGERVMEVDVVADGDSFQAGRQQSLLEGVYLVGTGMSEAFDVTPDGQRFVMLRPQYRGETIENNATFILNWFEEIRRLTSAVGS